MRMDDNVVVSAAPEPAFSEPAPLASVEPSPRKRSLRFTSNVVGSLFLFTDVLCFIISAPITFVAYSLLRGQGVVLSVHLTAFVLMLGSYLLIRASRQAYRRSLLDLSDSSDTTFDAVISSLIASALIWQAGLVDNYSRGITLLFLLSVVLSLSASRPFLHRIITRLAEQGKIEQRIAFYGADPDSVSLTRRLLESLNFPHLRFVGIADDRSRVTRLEGLPMIGDLPRLCEMARQAPRTDRRRSERSLRRRLAYSFAGDRAVAQLSGQLARHRAGPDPMAAAVPGHESSRKAGRGPAFRLARIDPAVAHPAYRCTSGAIHQPGPNPVRPATHGLQ
jgi:hypothetical protein